ncbi:MAG TPA: class I SAM-dependent methyltransferase [Acidimicrobiales bacterium]|nr:class I SAM-dependent methyltransferase [Acidimicrobiales bacterium]
MGFYSDRVAPRLIDACLGGKAFLPLRERTAAGLSGDVLELGFGSGRNVDAYPDEVRRVLAVDPQPQARRMAAPRVARSRAPISYVELDEGETLRLDDASVDHALSTFTLCSVADPSVTLGEVRRVLRPGGRLHFLEHGRSPEQRVAKWQDRLTPLQRRFVGGCHLNRPIDRLLADAGFEVTQMRHYYLQAPRPSGYMYEGVAARR